MPRDLEVRVCVSAMSASISSTCSRMLTFASVSSTQALVEGTTLKYSVETASSFDSQILLAWMSSNAAFLCASASPLTASATVCEGRTDKSVRVLVSIPFAWSTRSDVTCPRGISSRLISALFILWRMVSSSNNISTRHATRSSILLRFSSMLSLPLLISSCCLLEAPPPTVLASSTHPYILGLVRKLCRWSHSLPVFLRNHFLKFWIASALSA
mmetsp:Transcript_4494/g.7311  ORF Transcript_4494/g.7311 Transcript_4494/m.7311 type:complete len:214 (-) Transcript_4494:719-1360(-)